MKSTNQKNSAHLNDGREKEAKDVAAANLLNVKEGSERLRISVSKTYELVAQGRLAHYRDGGGPIRFSEDHIRDYLASIEHGRGETWPVTKEHELTHVRLRRP